MNVYSQMQCLIISKNVSYVWLSISKPPSKYPKSFEPIVFGNLWPFIGSWWLKNNGWIFHICLILSWINYNRNVSGCLRICHHISILKANYCASVLQSVLLSIKILIPWHNTVPKRFVILSISLSSVRINWGSNKNMIYLIMTLLTFHYK